MCMIKCVIFSLIKGKDERPKYNVLMTMDFYKTYNVKDEDEIAQAQAIVGIFVANVLGYVSSNERGNNTYKALNTDWALFS